MSQTRASAVSSVRDYAESLGLQLKAADSLRGKIQVGRVLLRTRLKRARSDGVAEAIGVPMRGLGGEELFVRAGTSDLRNASYYYLSDLFLPPPALADSDLRQIVELGSNMGAALTALAARYPEARLLGVEPDPGNVAMARRNVARFGERCQVVEAGIWDAEVELAIVLTEREQHGLMVRPRLADDPPDIPAIKALTIDALLDRHMPDGQIDYMHVTIEGAEPRVFAAGGRWPARVRSLRVEAHPIFDYPAERCIEQLRALGYEAWPDPDRPDKWVYGLRS